MSLKIQSPAEQVSAHLREEIASGRWKDEMPGIAHLHAALGVNHVTINAALKQLESEGWLASQGRRRCRLIVRVPRRPESRPLRIKLLPYDQESRVEPDYLGILDELHQRNFAANISRKSLHELGMDKKRVARFVNKAEADAWIVSGASQEVFEWFAAQDFPTLALFGRFTDDPISGVGVRKTPIMSKLVRRLASLGHRRIVLLSHRERVVPKLALFERNFLEVMADCGIATGPFNLPEWEPTPNGLRHCLDTLFQHTPPTALIIEEPKHLIAVQNHLKSQGIKVPDEVSLICNDSDPSFPWCNPPVTHLSWDLKKVINHVVRWSNRVALGKNDQKQKFYDAELVEGGTIGPPPRQP